MSRSPGYWVVKRDFSNHYYRVESGTFVPTRREATHFTSLASAKDTRKMLRDMGCTHYGIAVVAVYGPRVKGVDECYQDGWNDAIKRALDVVDASERFCTSEAEKDGNAHAYNAVAKLRADAEAEDERRSAKVRSSQPKKSAAHRRSDTEGGG